MGRKAIWITLALLLIVIGAVVFAAAMMGAGWDFIKLETSKYETAEYEIDEDFEDISVITYTSDVALLPSEDGKCRVLSYEEERLRHNVTVSDGELKIEVVDTRKWYDHIGINFESPKITVYLPEREYSELSIDESTGDVTVSKDFSFSSVDISLSTGDVSLAASSTGPVKINSSTGDITLEEVSASAVDLSVSTGSIRLGKVSATGGIKLTVSTGAALLTDVICGSLSTSGSTGGVRLERVIASGKLYVERSTGGVELYGCDGGEIFIKTSTGGVSGTLLSDKTFVTDSGTGSIDVPKDTVGARCEIRTSTGSIKISIER